MRECFELLSVVMVCGETLFRVISVYVALTVEGGTFRMLFAAQDFLRLPSSSCNFGNGIFHIYSVRRLVFFLRGCTCFFSVET